MFSLEDKKRELAEALEAAKSEIWNVASHAWTGMNCFKIIFLIR